MGEKTFYVLESIKQAKEPISAKNIQAYLLAQNIKVDIKTVYSVIQRINDYYELLTGENYIQVQRRKGYYIENTYFKDGELQFLIDAITFNPNLGKREINHLQERLLELSNETQKQRLTITNIKESQQEYSLLLNLSTLLKAIMHQQNVYFTYVNYKVENRRLVEVNSENGNLKISNTNYYLVSPYKIVLRGSHYYLLGYFDKRKNQLSMYRLDRMRLVRNHNSHFIDIREQFDVDKDLEKNVNMFVSDHKIDLTLKFQDSVLREIVSQFGTNFEVYKEIEGWNVATIKEVTMSEGLIGWILMLQEQVEIIMPINLRDQVINKIHNMKKQYEV